MRELRGHVKPTVRTNARLMRPQRFAKINAVSKFALAHINNIDAAAIGAGLADAGIAVNRNVRKASVLAHGDFVTIDAHNNFGDLATRLRINEQSRVLVLIRDHEKSVSRRARAAQRRDEQENKGK